MKYDFISDVHGRLTKLIQLLEKAGYIKDSDGDYYHPEGRIAFFLGDIIDKGADVTETFFMVKRMVEKDYAKIVLGNHELNFIAIHLKNKKGKYLRKRDEGKLKQIEKSLDLLNYKEEVFNFIYDIPLFYEEKNIKVIHACWDRKYINHVKKYLSDDNKLNEDSYKKIYSDPVAFDALEIVLKGYELNIAPEGYHDKSGILRETCRYNWWEDKLDYETVPEHVELSSHLFEHMEKYRGDDYIFFGHYTKKGKPYVQSKRAMCLDFCREGYLTMYRFNESDKELNKSQLLFVK